MKVDVCGGCAGFCSGVQKAVNRALDLVRENGGKPIMYDIPIVHNGTVMAELEELGFRRVSDNDDPQCSIFCGSAHGLSPEEYQRLEEHYNQVVDTTCPRVNKSQRLTTIISRFCDKIIVLATKPDHPETVGLLGYVDGEYKGIIVVSADDPRLKEIKSTTMVGLITQSTISSEAFVAFEGEFIKRFPRHFIAASLCPEILARRAKFLDEAGKPDYQIAVIVGGRESANTRALAEAVENRYRQFLVVFCVEDENDPAIVPETFAGKKGIIVAGGTSTPIEVVEKVAAKIRSFAP